MADNKEGFLIFFSTKDGKIINEELDSLSEQEFHRLAGGVVRSNHAIIKNGYVANFKEILQRQEELVQKANRKAKTNSPEIAFSPHMDMNTEPRINIPSHLQNEKKEQQLTAPAWVNDNYNKAREERKQANNKNVDRSEKRKYDRKLSKNVPKKKERQARNRSSQIHIDPNKEKEMRNKIKRFTTKAKIFALGVAVTAGITAGAATVDHFHDEYVRSRTEFDIGAMDDGQVQRYHQGLPIQSIIDRNTEYNQNHSVYWYNHHGIAQDLLELPDYLFEPGLYCVYEEMGANRQNAEHDNLGSVISMLSNYAEAEQNPTAFAKCNGCSNFEEYLIKNGFVNSEGEPDYSAWEDYGKQLLITYNNEAFIDREEARSNGGR